MMEPIRTEGLAKTYPGGVKAVEDVTISVREGEIFGFLGPNGAGKTTTVSMLTAGLLPTAGRAFIDGLDVREEPEAVKRRIGIIFQESTADADLTGRENLELGGALYGLSRAETRARTRQLLDRMALSEASGRLVKTFSGGMRRRLELAVGLIHSPSILFLDEPTLGLDPQGRAGFWKYIQELRKDHGLTVFVTTHYLDEADSLCDRLAIIDHGHIVASGTPGELKDRLGGDVVTVRVTGEGTERTELFRSVAGVTDVQRQADSYRLKCANGEATVPRVVEACARAGVGVSSIALKRPSLDEVFLEYTGREFREEEGPSATDWAVRLHHLRQRPGARR